MQSAAAAEQSDGQRPPARRGRPWPKGVSGNPSGSRVNTRAVVLFAEMANDFGGGDALSGVDRAMLMQACRLMARGARAKSADDAVRLTSEARRILQSLRKSAPKHAAGPTLAEFLASLADSERLAEESEREPDTGEADEEKPARGLPGAPGGGAAT